MECGCLIDRYWGDAEEIWNCKTVTRSKPRQCSECNRRIAPGEKMEICLEYRENDNGDMVRTENQQRFHICSDCQSIISAYFCGVSLGCVLDDLWERIEEDPDSFVTSQLARLTPDAREIVCDMIEKEWARAEKEAA